MLISILHWKILNLNAAMISWQTTGQILNYATNDLKHFDMGVEYISFVIIGPIDLLLSIIVLGLDIGFLPSILGFLVLILSIPLQVLYFFSNKHFFP